MSELSIFFQFFPCSSSLFLWLIVAALDITGLRVRSTGLDNQIGKRRPAEVFAVRLDQLV